jgi:hypothetical protein
MRFPQAFYTPEDTVSCMWPIGSVFISAVTTNPAELLGVGVWEEIGQGRVLIGQDAGQPEFDALGKTGGAKTSSAVVNHTHPVNVSDPGHTHVEQNNAATTGGLAGWPTRDTSTSTAVATGYSTLPASTGITATTADPAGGVANFSLLNPYFCVKFWKRTG